MRAKVYSVVKTFDKKQKEFDQYQDSFRHEVIGDGNDVFSNIEPRRLKPDSVYTSFQVSENVGSIEDDSIVKVYVSSSASKADIRMALNKALKANNRPWFSSVSTRMDRLMGPPLPMPTMVPIP